MNNFKECVKRLIIDGESLFTDDQDIFNKDSITYLIDNFIENGYGGDAPSDEKFKQQLVTKPVKPANDEIKRKAVLLLAHAVWMWRIAPRNATKESRKKSVQGVLDYIGLEFGANDCESCLDIKGYASTGTYYNTNKPFELAYIIRLFEALSKIDNLSQDNLSDKVVEILSREDFSGKVTILEIQNIKGSTTSSGSSTKSVSIHNALLYLFSPERYQPILSNGHKKLIIETFSKYCSAEGDIDIQLDSIKTALMNINKWKDSFYDEHLKQIWQGGLDFEAKNIILHGAPGTGKTYMTENTIKNRIDFEGGKYILVQFHPSYGYEDFIDGVKPAEISANGSMTFELVNGEFKGMCIEAFGELQKAYKENREAKKYYFIADEINRAELSRVFGELLLCLEDDKRLRFEDDKLLGTKIKTQNSKLWKKEHAVVVEDEEYYFGVPENLYFIGTMNDIDRSVDSFDMALRRRFLWKHYRCDYDVIMEHYNLDENDQYITMCEELNKYITSEKGFNLGESYELGHSYFIKPKVLNQAQLDKTWIENIAPLLKEYLRSEYPENDIENHLKDAKSKFTLPKKAKNDTNG